MDENLDKTYDVLVIGGGAAGLSGALTLARARWKVAVIDAGEPRNAPAAGVHGLLGREGVSPAELVATGRDEVRSYGGRVVDGRVAQVVRDDGGTHPFAVTLDDGRVTRARRLLVATGLVDELPDVPGLAEHWGRDVVHCPFCHGYEVRDQRIGVLATGPQGTHQALLFSQWSDQVVLLAHTAPDLSPDDAAKLAARGVTVVAGKVREVTARDGRLTGVVLADGTAVPLDAVAVATTMRARTDVVRQLGLEVAPHPSGQGEHVVADATGRTSVRGVWVAGNATNLAAQVSTAAAEGTWAAAQLTFDLIEEDATAATAG
ncbi:NAD(P)/FAD-dependent oxidoreductase [Isoptericola sp. S6320L]|uniref:NAD(P)/FAD-dependent oxidoreductase n=1 Tax=Isoptericola sp. S6320L TaxID=2926411 RepID=UPI001FF2A085|nr:NAD(P)/FAD-dependent oxidoreductase [Isoptericola sp. S6320L]MCK0117145.1 NAD(P)/FAD-dependent oxidoreductase [Isoptericola sp. S6320L]